MMNCPRCGFTQPEDQYCAKCGVDMINFKEHTPLHKKAMNSSQLHLIIIFSIILGTLFYLVVSQRDLIEQEVTKIFPGIPLLSSKASDGTESEPEGAREGSSVANSKIADSEPPAPTETKTNGAAGSDFIEPSARTGQPNESQKPPSVEVRYLEVSKNNIQALVSSGEVLQDLENWRGIYLPSSPSVKSLIRSSRSLPGQATQALPPRGELEILSGDYDPDPLKSFLNFSMIWTLPDQVEWSLITQLRSLEGPQDTMLVREYQGRMTWNPRGALILVFDPIQRIPTAPNANLSSSPLRILQSPDFQNGLSDLIIWVEVTNLPKLY